VIAFVDAMSWPVCGTKKQVRVIAPGAEKIIWTLIEALAWHSPHRLALLWLLRLELLLTYQNLLTHRAAFVRIYV
jgi:hypothetical protein